MKITFVIPYFYPAWVYGGTPRSAFELARGLVRRGHSVQVLTTDSGGESRLPDIGTDRNVEGIQVRYYSTISNSLAYRYRVFWSPEFLRQIRKQIAGTDLVHIHELRSMTSVSAYHAAMATHVPYVVSAHGGLQHLGKRLAKTVFDELWGKRILAQAATLIAVSPVEERQAAVFGIEAKRIRRLSNAVNVDDYRDLPPRDVFRCRWRLGPGKIALFLGRLHPIKGADILLEAFRTLGDTQPDVQLVIAGPDDGQEIELRNRVHAMRLNDRVIFTGFLSDAQKREALAGSDVTVIPSRSEVFALSAVESLISGTPVIMSSSCGLHPLPKPDEGVIPFVNGSAKDLSEKLFKVVGPEPLRYDPASGRRFVIREFSVGAVAEQAERIYQEILDREIEETRRRRL